MLKWRDTYGMRLKYGDLVEDCNKLYIGYITHDSWDHPCIFITMRFNRNTESWERVEVSGPIEAYLKPLYKFSKSKLYWRLHRYILPDIVLLKNKINHR